MRDLFPSLLLKQVELSLAAPYFFGLDTGLRVLAVSIPQRRESSIIEDYDL